MSASVQVAVMNYLDPRLVSEVAAAASIPALACDMLVVQQSIGCISGDVACDALGLPEYDPVNLGWEEAAELLTDAASRVSHAEQESILYALAQLETATAAQHAGLISEIRFLRCC